MPIKKSPSGRILRTKPLQPGMQHLELAVNDCARRLSERQLTICFAESATAGGLAYAFSKTKYAGTVLKGGLICYDACLKEDILSVPAELIGKFTPESPEVTREMALRLVNVIHADLYVAVTGLTKPGGSETAEKPVGTMFYAILFQGTVYERRTFLAGLQEAVVRHTIREVARTINQVV